MWTASTASVRSKELDGMTKVFGSVAWLAVAVIAIFGVARGQSFCTNVGRPTGASDFTTAWPTAITPANWRVP